MHINIYIYIYLYTCVHTRTQHWAQHIYTHNLSFPSLLIFLKIDFHHLLFFFSFLYTSSFELCMRNHRLYCRYSIDLFIQIALKRVWSSKYWKQTWTVGGESATKARRVGHQPRAWLSLRRWISHLLPWTLRWRLVFRLLRPMEGCGWDSEYGLALYGNIWCGWDR